MDARELRIGNWFANREGGYQQVTIENLEYLCNDKYKPHLSMQPIPLTEQLVITTKEPLKKAGYEIIRTQDLGDKYPAEYILQGSYSEGDGGYYLIGNVDFVHRLQNLFYALELKELEIKNP